MSSLTIPRRHVRTPDVADLRAMVAALVLAVVAGAAFVMVTTAFTRSAPARPVPPARPSSTARGPLPDPRPQAPPVPGAAHREGPLSDGTR